MPPTPDLPESFIVGFTRGFRAMLPIWLGVVPFGLAYAVTARAAGLGLLETQSLSVFVFAGSSQFSAANQFAMGASGVTIVLTTFLLNVRHLLYGLSLARYMQLRPLERLVAAYFLTDEAYGVMVASGERRFSFLLGTELSLFFSWNVATVVGALLGSSIPDPAAYGVDFVFPLAFLALLIPILKTGTEVTVAIVSGALALLLARVLPGGLPILITGVLGSLLGALLTRNESIPPATLEDAAREVA